MEDFFRGYINSRSIITAELMSIIDSIQYTK